MQIFKKKEDNEIDELEKIIKNYPAEKNIQLLKNIEENKK